MIWNVSDGRLSAPPITGHVGRIVALSFSKSFGRLVLVSAGK